MFKGEWEVVIGGTPPPDPDTGMSSWPTITVYDFEIPGSHGEEEKEA